MILVLLEARAVCTPPIPSSRGAPLRLRLRRRSGAIAVHRELRQKLSWSYVYL